ncbi:uncharacterized protein BDR25DRAFT_333388 [Lindgomyces ingoldianus]|uniref:Uncharacterized protein n=1 Tax=Lindgomyces ingoldianus TaxID=673940 RepID=A0ACB6R2S0_9PLEO|nr:uncharacterized protein BDR25DRAFT_333388 [Lindgomyces ingoldianus]KAF2472627.1 hypothetical protein BDR25DRAFT_333388 [Lindgomyces ingoldianus]
MAAPIVYDDVADGADLEGQLFAGKKFWVAQRCPLRNYYLNLIKSNGGQVVMLEKLADYLIADHLRKDCPPGSISYMFLDKSIKKGELDDPEKYPAGPPIGKARDAGSIRPSKGVRTSYTAEDDRVLYRWVQDHLKQGGSDAGNELYKQLEARNPRHTWQSWRDRYIKQLRDRPPSAFNIPENAPPSPPSDQSAGQMPPDRTSPEKGKKPAQRKTRKHQARKDQPSPEQTTLADPSGRNHDPAVDDLEALFSKRDWEDLYANVHLISSVTIAEYLTAWEGWAGGTTQTADQWKQYFEKVVLPQWKQDPEWKREKIKNEFIERQARESKEKGEEAEAEAEMSGPSTSQAGSSKAVLEQGEASSEDALIEKFLKTRKGKAVATAYQFFARERKWVVWEDKPGLDYVGLHEILHPWYKALSEEDKAPYLTMEAADRKRFEIENKLSPQAMKRIRALEDELDEPPEEHNSSPHPSKRQKQLSSPLTKRGHPKPAQGLGTQIKPLEISSGEGSSSSQDMENQPQPKDYNTEDIIQAELRTQDITEEDEELYDPDRPTPTTECDDVQMPPDTQALRPVFSDQLPSNTPTPRAPRHKPAAFNTQAILSSPTQGLSFTALPKPQPESRSPSPSIQASPLTRHVNSISASHSLREFRHSINSTSEPHSHAFAPVPCPREPSTAPSEASSAGSGDPDPPLDAVEIDEFFSEQHGEGFTDAEIAAALKHTRCRPLLAMEVLDAWKDDKPLPDRRGVWSKEDDENVEGGDGVALAELERKHTCDGWGGITERLRFLEQARRKR